MSQALYRKWRPARFKDVIGQHHITETLQNSVAADRVGHAYLLCGPRGTGKTTTARLLAKAVNCTGEDVSQRPCDDCPACHALNDGRFLDLIEIDAASNTGVDDMRSLRDKVNFAPSEGRFKVYIIDEVHMLSIAAFNALLKTLEEPPAHIKFILATTEEHKVPVTIKSRCQQFNFRLLTTPEINGRLQWLAKQEGLTVEPAALDLIAQQGAGSLRDAESLMDQLITSPDVPITLKQTQMVLGTATETAVSTVVNAWISRSSGEGLHIIHEALISGADARQFARQMVAYLRELLLLKAAGNEIPLAGTPERRQTMLAQTEQTSTSALIKAVKAFSEAAMAAASSWQPQLPLELAFIGLMDDQPATVVAAIPQPVASTPSPLHVKTAVIEKVIQPIAKPSPAPLKPVVAEQPIVVKSAEKTGEETPLTLSAAKKKWRDMVAQVGGRSKNLPALLNMGKVIGLEGTVIVIGFDYPIFKEKFEKTTDAVPLINQAYSTLFNTKCTVRAVITSEYAVPIKEADVRDLAKELGGVVSIKE